MTFLINGLFDSIISYKTHVGRKNQIDLGRSSICKMCWFIYQLTVACHCCNINRKTCYIIFITAKPCFKATYENWISNLYFILIVICLSQTIRQYSESNSLQALTPVLGYFLFFPLMKTIVPFKPVFKFREYSILFLNKYQIRNCGTRYSEKKRAVVFDLIWLLRCLD